VTALQILEIKNLYLPVHYVWLRMRITSVRNKALRGLNLIKILSLAAWMQQAS